MVRLPFALIGLLMFAVGIPALAQVKPAVVSNALARLEIVPAAIVLNGSKARQQMLVNGYRPDGSVIDLTDASRFESSDRRVLRVEDGVALPVGDGSATISAYV